jgi:hypothetical protein
MVVQFFLYFAAAKLVIGSGLRFPTGIFLHAAAHIDFEPHSFLCKRAGYVELFPHS